MNEKKVTDTMLDRIKYFINAIENGEYKPTGYEFTITLHTAPNNPRDNVIRITDYSPNI